MGAYEDAPHLFRFATLYRHLGQMGIPPPVVRDMTPQQVGAFLGVGFPDTPETVSEGSGRDVNRERFEWLAAINEAREAGDETRALELEASPPQPDAPRGPVSAAGGAQIGPQMVSGSQVTPGPTEDALGPHVFHPGQKMD